MIPTAPTTTGAPPHERFSARLRAETTPDHRAAERSEAMGELLAGRLPLAGYAALLAQLLPVYEVLEELGRAHRDDPCAAPFIDVAIHRAPALRADLAVLPDAVGGGVPTPATAAYCDHLAAVGPDPLCFVAHHYTRYLGDLSGGQHIGRAVERRYGLGRSSGTSFFHFDDVADGDALKDRYRSRLDDAPWSTAEQDRFIAEVRTAYRLNGELLAAVPVPTPGGPPG